MDVMEPVVEDREDLLRNEVIQLFGKYYRNVRQMTPEQRVAYRSQLSSLFARANETLRNYVNRATNFSIMVAGSIRKAMRFSLVIMFSIMQ